MQQRIIFQPAEAPVAVLTPAECGLTLLEIGQKDVPVGLPFWIVDVVDLPEDRTYRAAWELDASAMGEPQGYGEPKA